MLAEIVLTSGKTKTGASEQIIIYQATPEPTAAVQAPEAADSEEATPGPSEPTPEPTEKAPPNRYGSEALLCL